MDNIFEFRRNFAIDMCWRHWSLVKNSVEDGCLRLALKRERSRCHFVKNNTKRKEVSARIQIFAERLFRRHVRNGSHRRTGTGQVFQCRGRWCRHSGFSDVARDGCHFGQSKIENLRVPSLGEKDIRWFDVTVHDPCGMSGIQRVGNLDG
jgi:hypothetical protein